jgi:hypothetical protein
MPCADCAFDVDFTLHWKSTSEGGPSRWLLDMLKNLDFIIYSKFMQRNDLMIFLDYYIAEKCTWSKGQCLVTARLGMMHICMSVRVASWALAASGEKTAEVDALL